MSSSLVSVNATDINSLEQQLYDLEQKNKKYQEILEKTQSDIREKEKYSKALVNKIKVLDDKIEISRKKIDELNSNIKEKQAEIDQANRDIESQMDTLKNRIRELYMAGNTTDLEIILGAKDFNDFIDKMSLVKILSGYDKNLIDEIQTRLDGIAEQKLELEADKANVEVEQISLEADQKEFNILLEENDDLLRNLYSTNDETQDAIKDTVIESEVIESQISAYYEAKRQELINSQNQQNQNNSNNSSLGSAGNNYVDSDNITSSGYVWPLPGFYYLSSLWNEDRQTYNHGAIDIAGAGIMGATTVAADKGTVFATYNGCYHNWGKNGSCGCGGGYGNYVMIDHGNGKITVYAHLTSLTVFNGQTVAKGQTVGYVGSTGNSTGPHLHFECRLNGVKYNPMLEY